MPNQIFREKTLQKIFRHNYYFMQSTTWVHFPPILFPIDVNEILQIDKLNLFLNTGDSWFIMIVCIRKVLRECLCALQILIQKIEKLKNKKNNLKRWHQNIPLTYYLKISIFKQNDISFRSMIIYYCIFSACISFSQILSLFLQKMIFTA